MNATPEIAYGQDQSQLPRAVMGTDEQMRAYGRQLAREAMEKVERERKRKREKDNGY